MFDRLRLPPGDDEGVVTAFRDGQVTRRENRRSDGFTFATKEIGYQGVRAGDLVVHSMDGFAGAIGVSESTGKCSPVYVVCDPKPGVDARFHAYVLRHMALSGYITSLAKGIRERSTSFGWGELKDEWLPLPTQATQKAIAAFLDRKTAAIDALIEKKQKLLDLLAEKRAALINQAVTKGLDPNVPMKDSGIPWIGEIPAHWEVKRLKFVCTLETGHTPSRSEPSYWVEEECVIPWVSLNDTKTLKQADYISETTYKISPLGMANSAAHLIPAGSVVFTRDATIGLTAILTKPMAVSQHIIGWVCGPKMDNEFLLQVLGSMTQELNRVTFGATLKTIGMADVKELTTPLPPPEAQRQIVAHLRMNLDRIRGMTVRLLSQLDRLNEYRQALITAAVTGQLDITEDAPA
ncbi:MAG: restriction endonuclease subunit S [Nannocystaceae bacterium]